MERGESDSQWKNQRFSVRCNLIYRPPVLVPALFGDLNVMVIPLAMVTGNCFRLVGHIFLLGMDFSLLLDYIRRSDMNGIGLHPNIVDSLKILLPFAVVIVLWNRSLREDFNFLGNSNNTYGVSLNVLLSLELSID